VSRPTRAAPGGRAYLDLQNLSRREGQDMQTLLVLYVLERFLARLAVSEHADRFVLKGGMLLAALRARRATVDADFLATQLANDEATVLARIVEIALVTPPVEDGVSYRVHTARAGTIRDGDLYTGVRVSMDVAVAAAVVKLRLDVSVGDPVTPAPAPVAYPTLLQGHPDFTVLGYPLVTVLAEKLCSAVDLGAGNSRVRDYADIWTLTGLHDLHGNQLHAALQATSTHRGVELRSLTLVLKDFAATRADTYDAYRRRLGAYADHLPESLAAVVAAVISFAEPVLTGSLPHDSTWRAVPRTWRQP
jgi:Nucleotidyl transferase AbiEii toxin, Type IV TA system